MNRRDFLKSSAAAPYVLTTAALGNAAAKPASDRVTVAFIGTGTRGGDGLIPMFLPVGECQVVAVCDAFRDRREKRAKQIEDFYAQRDGAGSYKGCTMHADFRDVLARKDLDAVVIATPDHWHIPLAILAAQAGKDVYLEKPLGISLVQAKRLRQVLAEKKSVFQYGTQQRSTAHIRYACELVRSGRVGKVHTVVVLAPGGDRGGSTAEMPIPEGFDYEMWTGPAPMRPYNDDRCRKPWPGHYFIYDNCLGFIAGWGAHPLDVAQWGLGTDNTSPVEYEGNGIIPKEGLFDAVSNWTIRAKYGNGVNLLFMDDHTNVTRFIGTEGWISVSRRSIDADPKSLIDPNVKPAQDNSVDHARNFIRAIKTRGTTIAPFENAIRSDTISHLSNIAIRTGRKSGGIRRRKRSLTTPQRPPCSSGQCGNRGLYRRTNRVRTRFICFREVSMSYRRFVCVLFILVFSSALLNAQNLGSIVGLVTDKTGAVIPAAEIRITDQATGLTRTFTTNETGTYVANALPLSKYTVEVATKGFKTWRATDVVLNLRDVIRVDVGLDVGEIAETMKSKRRWSGFRRRTRPFPRS